MPWGMQHTWRNASRCRIQNNDTITAHTLQLRLRVWDEVIADALRVDDTRGSGGAVQLVRILYNFRFFAFQQNCRVQLNSSPCFFTLSMAINVPILLKWFSSNGGDLNVLCCTALGKWLGRRRPDGCWSSPPSDPGRA